MTRDDGWRFLIIGRRLERLIFLAGAIGEFLRLDSARVPGCLEWLLELADSIITYRSRYMSAPELLPAIDLIVFDDANPHSVMFQVENLIRYLGGLSRELGDPEHDPLIASLARLRDFDIGCFEGNAAGDGGDASARGDMADLLAEIVWQASSLSDRLAMRYFTHIGDVGRQTLAA
jgi:uncharacterized alpha-E superfamily protein